MGVQRCVILGDVIESRAATDRTAVGDALATGIDEANTVATDALHAPFTVLKGVDELGGVLTDPSPTYAAITAIVEALHPHEIRFGIAWDTVDIATDSDDVATMDGPAFHRADELLATVTDTDRYVGIDLAPITTPPTSTLLGGYCDLLSLWKAAWTPRQCDVVSAYRNAETMQAVADDLDVTVNTISKTLQRAHAHTILSVESDLETAFDHLGTETTQ